MQWRIQKRVRGYKPYNVFKIKKKNVINFYIKTVNHFLFIFNYLLILIEKVKIFNDLN